MKTGLDLTQPKRLNRPVPAAARWWECATCGDYAWLWPGELPPECSCEEQACPIECSHCHGRATPCGECGYCTLDCRCLEAAS